MDRDTRKSIFKMKSQGLSNQAVASLLGLKKDTLHEFCKKYHLIGPSEVIRLNIIELEQQNIICPHCCGPIRQKKRGRRKRFCSEKCRRAWWKENEEARSKKPKALYSNHCLACGKYFIVYGNHRQKYCSRACYLNHRYRREKDGVQKDKY